MASACDTRKPGIHPPDPVESTRAA